ncbi:hypothetical protein CBR_g36747 [Chara braunii]|uniref:Riboflavin synthase n=1 Tax=Chara braunii TaxID=69332 RepID=A0A388LLD2_CHABU|nr:hypothetical protein CBR_g36747 [Chara braunii]|eukprot:GBG83129.1 hypothetical protein CBR_g36747 [Chara braunii]
MHAAAHWCEHGVRSHLASPLEGRVTELAVASTPASARLHSATTTSSSRHPFYGTSSQPCHELAAGSLSRLAPVWEVSDPTRPLVPVSVPVSGPRSAPEGRFCPVPRVVNRGCMASLPSAFLGRRLTRGGTRIAPTNVLLPSPRFSLPKSAVPKALFTGIVEEMGTVQELRQVDNEGWELTVKASKVLEGVNLGDSIAVNGTCLTVTRFDCTSFDVGLSPETLRRTSLGEVSEGSLVNLERSLRPDSRMGGHFVQGHVDGTGQIVDFWPEGDSLWVKVKTTPDILRYVVPKGYIAVDGTSLTVVDVSDEESSFSFMLVAYTQTKVVIPKKEVGQLVNLEVDIVGKYVERLVQGYRQGMPTTLQSSSS